MYSASLSVGNDIVIVCARLILSRAIEYSCNTKQNLCHFFTSYLVSLTRIMPSSFLLFPPRPFQSFFFLSWSLSFAMSFFFLPPGAVSYYFLFTFFFGVPLWLVKDKFIGNINFVFLYMRHYIIFLPYFFTFCPIRRPLSHFLLAFIIQTCST